MSLFLVLIFSTAVWGTESCTGSASVEKTYSGNDIIRYTWTWVSAADGTASCTAVNFYGRLVAVETDPGAAAPTDDYDIDINWGVTDIMGSALDNRDTANTEVAFPQKGTDFPDAVWLSGPLTAEVSAAGDTKGGAITLIIVP